jgi:hypothetical protein
MNILTIDIDFISNHYLQGELAKNVGKKITEQYWESVLELSGVMPHSLEENRHNVRYIFDLFMKSIMNNDNIVFGYHHDAILNHIDLESKEKIFLMNVDHHHDQGYCDYHDIQTNLMNESDEGAWVNLLQDRIKEYIWVKNKNSEVNKLNPPYPSFSCEYKDAPKFGEDHKWDLIYVCLSPSYTSDVHWHYFYLLVDMYRNLKNKEATIDVGRFTKELTNYEEQYLGK